MATFGELSSMLGYDSLAPMYEQLVGGNPFLYSNPESGLPNHLDATSAQVYGQFDPSKLDPYQFSFAKSGPGNSGTLSAFQDGKQLGSWSQYDTPFSETLRDAVLTAGAAFGGLGLAGAGPLSGLQGFGGFGGLNGLDAAFVDMGGGLTGLGGSAGSALTGAAGAGGGGMLGSWGSWGFDPSALMGSMGSGSNLLSIGGNLLSGYMQSDAAGDAARAMRNAGRESNALQKQMFDTIRGDYAPYRQAGYDALGQIQGLLKDPSSLASQPGYQFGLQQGQNALADSAAARGMTYSGAQGKALQQFGQDYAGTKLNDAYNRLASIAGIGQQATGSTSQAGMNYAGNVGNTLMQMGNARGSGYVGQNNAWSQAFGNILNDVQQQDMLKQLGLGG